MIAKLKDTLNRYESIVDAFKRQIETINANKLLNCPATTSTEVEEPVDKPKRQKNNSEMRGKAIEMMLNLMDMEKLSKHKASKVVSKELGLRARTVYSWLVGKKN